MSFSLNAELHGDLVKLLLNKPKCSCVWHRLGKPGGTAAVEAVASAARWNRQHRDCCDGRRCQLCLGVAALTITMVTDEIANGKKIKTNCNFWINFIKKNTFDFPEIAVITITKDVGNWPHFHLVGGAQLWSKTERRLLSPLTSSGIKWQQAKNVAVFHSLTRWGGRHFIRNILLKYCVQMPWKYC